ncbi:hypothetical protein SNOG_03227 [Parastagonospora nodorum SN15]|uniref:Uncharacterized protein n=1 Tax=Phaeosphaeria nodorum (strain SN15 / ATCC MYA-4574 / FGSC 10173) TaxID=321614 RepID=Q0UYD7_PHANO|nr:hypothetical protein SNOG_03227 [Parastagonospora nodorum SN15]EAT89958.1 hypothetical protein SNOG_03227 [Parastagonospora nodorum SN15]
MVIWDWIEVWYGKRLRAYEEYDAERGGGTSCDGIGS